MPFLKKLKDLFTKPPPPPTQSNTYFLTPTTKLSTPMPSNYIAQPPPMAQPFTPFIPSDFPSIPFMPQPPIMSSLEMYGPGTQQFNPPAQFTQPYNDKGRQADIPRNVHIADNGRRSRNYAKSHRHHNIRPSSRTHRRNYSAEWAVNHPEVLTDFFAKSARNNNKRFPPHNEIISVRTVKETIHRKSRNGPVSTAERIPRRDSKRRSVSRHEDSRQRSISRRNSRQRSTSRRRSRQRSTSRRKARQKSTFIANSSNQQYRESTEFHWKPITKELNITANVDERSDVPYDPLILSETDVNTPEGNVPKAPQLPLNFNTPPKSIAAEKKIYGSMRQNKIYENVVGELKDRITKLQGNVASSGENMNSVAPSNLLNKPRKPSPPKITPGISVPANPEEELKQTLSKGIQLRHVSPPVPPSLGRVIPPPRPSPPKNYTSDAHKPHNAPITSNFKPIRPEPSSSNGGERHPSHEERKPPTSTAAAFDANRFERTKTPPNNINYTSEKEIERNFLRSVENIIMNKEGSRFKQPDGSEWEVIVVKPDSEYENADDSSDETLSTISLLPTVKSNKPELTSSIFDSQSPVTQFPRTIQDRNIVSLYDFVGPSAFMS